MNTVKLIPAADIFEKENEYLLVAELPGVSKNTLEIEVENEELIIRGKPDWKKGEWNLSYGEFVDQYEFERVFSIGRDIDREKIKAGMENGILTLELPKAEEMKPRKIEIK